MMRTLALAAAMILVFAASPATAQHRGGNFHGGGPHWGGHPHWGGYRGGGGNFWGGAIIGGIIGSMLRPNTTVVVPNQGVEWCMQRYRSYNPETGTYVGYDGVVRACP